MFARARVRFDPKLRSGVKLGTTRNRSLRSVLFVMIVTRLLQSAYFE